MWFFGFGYFLSSLYWISISLTFDESFKYLIPFSLILVPSFLAVFYGLITLLFSLFFSKKITSSFLVFSVAFGTIEVIRSFIFTGFPWNLISFSFSNSIYFIQILSIIGTYSFNLICISLFTVRALFILRNSRKEIIIFFIFILLSAASLIFGKIKNDNFNSSKSIKNPYTIKAISPNISLDRFYSNQEELRIINELIELSAPTKVEPTIYLWPEGIIPESYLKDMSVYKNLFLNSFGENDFIIMGLNSREIKNYEYMYFNSMAIFNNNLDTIAVYNKVNLVPFGEFIPFESILSLIGLKTVTNSYQSFSKGETRAPLNVKNGKIDLNLLPLICYEIIYSGKLSRIIILII